MAKVNPRQIEAFRALMMTATTTRAAQVMNVTQPAVSRLVKDLQEALRLTLFEREGTRLTPTNEALSLYAEVERSFVGLERIAQAAKEIRERRAGTLRIAGMPALANGFLPRFAGRFLMARPGVDIAMFGLMSHMVLDWVVSDQCDFGFAAGPIQHVAARIEPLPAVRYVAVVPAGHRLARRRVIRAQDFERESFIALGPTTPSKFRLDDLFAREAVPRQVRAETPLSEIACAMVASGAGVSVVDPFTAAEFATRGVTARPFEPAVEFQVTALHPARRTLSAVGREFIHEFSSAIQAFRKEFRAAS